MKDFNERLGGVLRAGDMAPLHLIRLAVALQGEVEELQASLYGAASRFEDLADHIDSGPKDIDTGFMRASAARYYEASGRKPSREESK